MKGRQVVLDAIGGRRAAALMVDGRLEDLLIDPAEDGPPVPGTIYRGVVDRPVKGQGGVFLALPGGARGFVRQPKGLRQGQSVLAQVTGFAEPGKAVPLTLRLLFKSKYAIVTPGAPGLNISRQIRDEERRVALLKIAEPVAPEPPTGLILRSEAERVPDSEVVDDIAETVALAAALEGDVTGPPECLLDGADAHAMAWRDWGHPDAIETEPGGFDRCGVLDALEALRSTVQALEGGGSLAVEPTRALVAVDVNTGGDTSPAAGLKANLAAVRALPRALRLYGLGGQVVLDLAPMAKKDRRTIEQALRSALRSDPVETTLVGWTPLGHLELSRKRERAPLERAVLERM